MNKVKRIISLGSEVFTENEKGEWSLIYDGENMGRVFEDDVIDALKRKDRKNLIKHFPMYGFHN